MIGVFLKGMKYSECPGLDNQQIDFDNVEIQQPAELGSRVLSGGLIKKKVHGLIRLLLKQVNSCSSYCECIQEGTS